ncbi:hypothetical protein KI659_03350 [Litoribacter alkaliphilus]|uniref:Outer membrane protein beta-barrel domain-containing protein n=1 Tax=Litoribacter ruber TaxID=702568 RepID=A0AAP2CGA2_9BACT|nr:hypothetical protein [Litoribacter alkaliphilus]MBS9523044.1 hypothetical protein [Litoribacter alkaliphilus]
MKKLLFSAVILFFVANICKAQAPERSKSQGVFVEVLGNGLLYSVNYDTRFSQSMNGFGGRAGIGYIAIEGVRLTTVPLLVNYLFGHEKHFFEVGIGATIVAGSAETDNGFGPVGERDRASGAFGTMSIGYRLEPTDGGFLFRAGITPVFDSTVFWPLWPQLSFGYAF